VRAAGGQGRASCRGEAPAGSRLGPHGAVVPIDVLRRRNPAVTAAGQGEAVRDTDQLHVRGPPGLIQGLERRSG